MGSTTIAAPWRSSGDSAAPRPFSGASAVVRVGGPLGDPCRDCDRTWDIDIDPEHMHGALLTVRSAGGTALKLYARAVLKLYVRPNSREPSIDARRVLDRLFADVLIARDPVLYENSIEEDFL